MGRPSLKNCPYSATVRGDIRVGARRPAGRWTAEMWAEVGASISAPSAGQGKRDDTSDAARPSGPRAEA